MKLIDIHAHLQFPQFDNDREEVIRRTQEAGVGVINVGTDLKTSEAAIRLAEENENMWATVGLHPTDPPEAGKFVETLADLKKLAVHPKVVAIGECGLDYYRNTKHETRSAKQEEIFEKQIELALTLAKPLMIHCRAAYDDLLTILKNFPGRRGNVHFFTGDWPTARKFLDLGFTLSFSGVITFAPDYDEVVRNTPRQMILAETDCPFAAPRPWRGRRNEPCYVEEVVGRIAELKDFTPEQAAKTTLANARRLFGLPLPGID